ncbi:MAG TPA: GntR family transcriptional regulator [Chryseosolibacter sp.]|nr:GntR family transcriptional regulator [Chryseosolibacter sp.]
MQNLFEEIDENSKVPKYQQVADFFISTIGLGKVRVGDKMPSINETSDEFMLSRDTVEKAYRNLRRRGIITSVRGKGFYVTSNCKNNGNRILLVFNKLSDHKKIIYNSFIKHLGDTGTVDLHIHNSDSGTLEKIIVENLGRYDFYVIMPHLREDQQSVKDAINKIPTEKLLLINKDMDGIHGNYGCVYEDFAADIRQALNTGLERINRYTKLFLVFPDTHCYCEGIKDGFVYFCRENGLKYEVIGSAAEQHVRARELYVVIEEADLVELLKKATAKNLKPGKTFGLISYNDSPFKEILAGGISVLSTDFVRMGAEVANMIRTGTRVKAKNPFSLIIRRSI